MICLKKKKKNPPSPNPRAFFGRELKKTVCTESLASYVTSGTIWFCVCVRILLLHEGSWKSDSKHQTGKQPPARTDRLMFVCISPATISVCAPVCHLMHVFAKYILSHLAGIYDSTAKTGFKALFVLRLHRKAAFLNSLQANGSGLSSLSASC